MLTRARLLLGTSLALLAGSRGLPAGAQSLFWAARYDGGLQLDAAASPCRVASPFAASARCVAVDPAGSAYVAGSATNGADNDFLLLKHDAAGNQQWALVYDSGKDDSAHALALAGDGSVYVGGVAKTTGGSDEALQIVKYDASGAREWVLRQPSPPRAWRVTGLGTDVTGNLYAVVDLFNTTARVCVLKLSPAGGLLWSRQYPEDGSTVAPWAMRVGAAGDVFVAGATYPLATPLVHHFVAMKWDSSGTLQWATYESGSSEAYPLDIGIDGGGNVYLAGRNKVSGYDDFLTVKYAADGTLLWARSYGGINDERASALAVAGDGTVYVAGQADNVLTTLAYDADGTLRWTASESAWSVSFARDAALDADGNLLVTAAGPLGWLTVKYSGAGVRQWASAPASALGGWPASLAVAPAGDVVVGGASTGSSTDLRVLRYAGATGTQLWSRSEPPLGHGSDTPCDFDPNSLPSTTSTKCLAVDAAGNSFLAGRSGNGANDDFRTLKYDPAGNLRWARTFDSGGDDRAYALALDGAGNVYVTGSSQGNYRTLKYAPDGSLAWSASYDGGGDDRAYAVVADGAGGAYVTGQAGSGAVTVAYDAAGSQRWVAPLGTGSGVALARGPGNTLLVAATVRPSSYKVIVTAKYDAAGSQLWQRTAGSLESSYARDLAVDPAGNVYVVGGSDDYFDEVEYLDFRALKYDAAGNLQWSRLWGGFVTDESAAALALDGAGAVYVTGISYTPGTTLPAWQTLKYDADGALQWATPWASGGNDRALAVAHDGAGGVYVAGSSGNPAGTRDVRVARYDAATGAQQWAETWDGGSQDTGLALALRAGGLHVAAASNGRGHDFVLLRYGNDSAAPSAPSSLASASHPLGGWGSATTLAARWSGAADEPGGSGLAGYSIVFDQAPDTTPDTSVDVPQAADPHQAASGPLAEGQWYLHVRACDHAGNCSAAAHAGPFGIDATPPLAATALASPSHQAGLASDDATVDVTWTPGSDALSGLVGQAHADWSRSLVAADGWQVLVGRWHRRFTHVPLTLITGDKKRVDPDGAQWLSVIETTGQPRLINEVA